MQHDAWLFIGVFVFIFLIWAATGGPLHPISFTGPRLAQPEELGGGTYLRFPRAPFALGTSNVTLRGADESVNYGAADASTQSFAGGSTFGAPSPYRGIVRMSRYVSGAGSINPKNEYLEISVAQNSVPINLSEWTFMSDASGKAARVPQGTEVPRSGVVNAAQDIVLAPGDRAIISSGSSPIGASFRENKCIGYFSGFQTFHPSLPQNCPVPSDELERFYGPGLIRDTSCIDYVERVPRCQVTLSPPVGLSNTCQGFLIEYLHYNGCVNAHKNDRDFLGNTWRIYLGRTEPLWRSKYELAKLLDVNGKTVDAFSY